MNQPWVYMCPSSWIPLPPPSSSHPSGLFQCTGFECPVSCIDLGLAIYFTYGNIHVSMLFSQIIPPSPSPTESKSLFFISVSLLLSCILLSCWKECIWISSNEVDEIGAYYTGWSKSERKTPIQYINAYMWNLESC